VQEVALNWVLVDVAGLLSMSSIVVDVVDCCRCCWVVGDGCCWVVVDVIGFYLMSLGSR
jgi:hypothetical protein